MYVFKFAWWENSIVYPGWQLCTVVPLNQHFRDQFHLMMWDRGSHWNAGELGATWGCSYQPLKIWFNTASSLIMLQYICASHYIKLSLFTLSSIVVKAAVTHRNLWLQIVERIMDSLQRKSVDAVTIFFAEHLNINKLLIQNTQLNKCTHKYIQHHLNLVQIIVVI